MGDDGIITSASQALDVFEFEAAAKKTLAAAPTHFGYLASGVDDDGTLKANREAFSLHTVRVRRLIDARKVDTSVKVLGETLSSPIMLAPVSSLAAFNPESGRAVARSRQEEAPDDPLDRCRHLHRRRDQGARVADLVHVVPHRRLERDAGLGHAG